MIPQVMIQFCSSGLEKIDWIEENGGSLSAPQLQALHRFRAELIELAQIARYETRSRVTHRQEMHVEAIFLDLDCWLERINE